MGANERTDTRNDCGETVKETKKNQGSRSIQNHSGIQAKRTSEGYEQRLWMAKSISELANRVVEKAARNAPTTTRPEV